MSNSTEKNNFEKTRYTHRDYESLKKDLISIIPSLTQKWTSTEESDPGIVLIKLISMLGDNLSYNMDKMALEMYLKSVTQRKNCAKILSLIGYKMHWYRSARVTATVKNLINGDTGEIGAGSEIILRPFETVFTAGNLKYTMIDMEYNTKEVTVRPTDQSMSINLAEGVINTANFKGKNLNNNRYYFSRTNVDESILLLYVNGVLRGRLVDNLYLTTDDYYVYFEFNVDEYDRPYIELVNYWQSLVGEEAEFSLKYLVTSGSKGNVTQNAFEYLKGSKGSYLYISNLANGIEDSANPFNSPGKDPQNCDDARRESADYAFTYDTLVSTSDFEKAAKRSAGIYNSKLVDGEIIKLDNLNLQEILKRPDDNTQFESLLVEETIGSDKVYRMIPYSVIMYLIHQDFTNNAYCDSDDENSQNKFFEDLANTKSEYVEDGSEGQKFFPYKPKNSTLLVVDQDMSTYKIMNVKLFYGTTKVYPFKVAGTVHFIEPLSPIDTLMIVDELIVDDLKQLFRPDNKSYGEKPNFIDIVDTIQSSDRRIKYFDADATMIEWVLGSAPKMDTTSFCKFQGLSDIFNVDSKFMRFEVNNTMEGGEEVILNAPGYEGASGTIPGYESIDASVKYGSSTIITCKNIPQLRTLCYYINVGQIAYVGGGDY